MIDAINLKNYFFYFASFVIIIAGVKMASEVVVILFLAIFISSIFSSVLNLLKNRKIPKIKKVPFFMSFKMLFRDFSYFVVCRLLSFALFLLLSFGVSK